MPTDLERLRNFLFHHHVQNVLHCEEPTLAAPVRQVGRKSKAEIETAAYEEAKKSFDAHWKLLRNVPGALPGLDDERPDPGCCFEVWEYQREVNPVEYNNPQKIKVDHIQSYDLDDPHIRGRVEEAREAHWKLVAPKGFAALKDIPELQQLIAYTAGDVVHYCVDSDKAGQPGCWRSRVGDTDDVPSSMLTHHHALHDSSSLMGQLCPGLRLCLAAEVAGGLMCDSQILPADTPEHGAALLLFLAAALHQVDNECQAPEFWPAGGSWRRNPGSHNLTSLADFYACLDPEDLLHSCLQEMQGPRSNSWGSSSSSNAASPTDSSRCDVPCPEDVGGSIFLAAVHVARRCSPLGNSPQSGAPHQQHDQQSTTNSSTTLSSTAAAPSEHQQQQPQSYNTAFNMLHGTAGMLDAFLDNVVQGNTPHGTQAADAQPCSHRSSKSSSRDSNMPGTTASDVAWRIAAVAGGSAVSQLLGQLPEWDLQASVDCNTVDAATPSSLMPAHVLCVHMALLATEICSLHEGTLELLQSAAAGTSSSVQSAMPAPISIQNSHKQQHRLQQQAGSSTDPYQDCRTTRLAVKKAVVDKMLQLIELARGLTDTCSRLCELLSSSSPNSCAESNKTDVSTQQAQSAQSCGEAGHRAGAGNTQHDNRCCGSRAASQLQHLMSVLQQLQYKAESPELWFQHVFALMGQQQCSLSCLHPEQFVQQHQHQQQGYEAMQNNCGASTAASTAPAAPAHAQGTAPGPEKNGCHSPAHHNALQELGQLWLAHLTAAHGKWVQRCQQKQQQQGLSDDSALYNQHGSDELLQFVLDPSVHSILLELLAPTCRWQQTWVEKAEQVMQTAIRRDMGLSLARMQQLQHLQDRKKASWQQAQEGNSNKRVAGGKGLHRAGAGSTKQEHATAVQNGSPTASVVPACELCAAEDALDGFSSVDDGSRSSNDNGSHRCSARGVCSRTPVSWTDPCLMRQLLWRLLGKLSPTAQAWFRTHANMCPHTSDIRPWMMVTMCLARHLWAPPGLWSEEHDLQMSLLLPCMVREAHASQASLFDDEAPQRSAYAHALNASFVLQGPTAQVAAVLSLQALHALDPHAAQLQPAPELLYYTPSGFHAAVCKALLQAVQPGQGNLGCDAPMQPPQKPAKQHQVQEHKHRCEQLLHPLQTWSHTLCPAWYVWWHVGLLAYQQQRRQQQQQPDQAGLAGCSTRGCSISPSSLQDLYKDPNARLFAVGYAARQVGSKAQLERLLNNPPVPAALRIPPTDWLSLMPAHFECSKCLRVVSPKTSSLQSRVHQPPAFASVLCCGCWSWYCCQACHDVRCSAGCAPTHLSQMKAAHKWPLLGLLAPVTNIPGQQQQQPQQPPDALRLPELGLSTPVVYIPQAHSNALPAAVQALVEPPASPMIQEPNQQQRSRPPQQPGISYQPLFTLYKRIDWSHIMEDRDSIISIMTRDFARHFSIATQPRPTYIQVSDATDLSRLVMHLTSEDQDELAQYQRQMPSDREQQRLHQQQRQHNYSMSRSVLPSSGNPSTAYSHPWWQQQQLDQHLPRTLQYGAHKKGADSYHHDDLDRPSTSLMVRSMSGSVSSFQSGTEHADWESGSN